MFKSIYDNKLNTGEDWVMADFVTNKTAIVKEISMNPEIALNDLVLYDVNKKITQIVKKGSRTVYFEYQISQVTFNLFVPHPEFYKISNYFKDNEIESVEFKTGLGGLSVPLNMPEEDFEIIFFNCPVMCSIIEVTEQTEGDDVKDQDNEFDDEE